MRGKNRAVTAACAGVLLLVTAYTVLRLLAAGSEGLFPRAARPGRLVVVGQQQDYTVEGLEVTLVLDSGQRVPLLYRDRLEAGEVEDEALFTGFDAGAAVWLRFVWGGERTGRAELETLAVEHPSALRATGIYICFEEDGLLVRTGGRQAAYRLRGGGWERMDEQA